MIFRMAFFVDQQNYSLSAGSLSISRTLYLKNLVILKNITKMKLKAYLLFFSCILSASLLSGQDGQEAVAAKQFRVSLGLNPLNFFEPLTPTLEGVVELHWKTKYSLELKYGAALSQLNLPTNDRVKGDYHEYKIGFKYNFDEMSPTVYPFIGLEFFAIDQKYTKTQDWFIRDGLSYYYDVSKVNRNVRSLRVKQGWHFKLDNRWYLESQFGLGVRRVTIDHNAENEMLTDDFLWDEWFTPIDRSVKDKIRGDFTLGLKVGFFLF